MMVLNPGVSQQLLSVCVLAGVQEKMGVMNRGVVYALWDYEPQNDDELGFSEGDCMTVLRREDDVEKEWWWARCGDREGYIPRNLLGVSHLHQASPLSTEGHNAKIIYHKNVRGRAM